MPELSRDFGTQTYEQQVVELSKTGEKAREVPAFRGRGPACGGGVSAGMEPGGGAAQTPRPPWVQRPRPGSRSGERMRFTCGATTTHCSSTTRSARWTPWPRCASSTTGSEPPRPRSCGLSAGCWLCSTVRLLGKRAWNGARGQWPAGPGLGSNKLGRCQQEFRGPVFLTKRQGCGDDKRAMCSFVKVSVGVKTSLRY